MSKLTLSYERGGVPILKIDGQQIDGLQVVVVEHDRNERGMPFVQIELIPTGEDIEIKDGTVHWIVGCPLCNYNSVHSCDIQTGEFQPVASVPNVPVMVADEVHEDRTVSGRIYPV